MSPWLNELARLAAVAQLAIPHERAAEVATSTATANARSVARRSDPEYTANAIHRPTNRTPTPRDAA